MNDPLTQTTRPDALSLLPSGGRADRPAAGGPVALWEIPGCSGASVELAKRHRGAGGQPEASVCRVPRRQGPDPRTKGRRRISGRKLSHPHIQIMGNHPSYITAGLANVFIKVGEFFLLRGVLRFSFL